MARKPLRPAACARGMRSLEIAKKARIKIAGFTGEISRGLPGSRAVAGE